MFQRIGRQLAILNVLVVIAIILLVGGATYVALRRSLTNEVDAVLRERIDAASNAPTTEQQRQNPSGDVESDEDEDNDEDDEEHERDHEIIESGDTIIFLVGPDGEIIANPRGISIPEAPVAEGIERALAGESSSLTVDIAGETMRVMTVPLTEDGQVTGAIQALRSLSEHQVQLDLVRTMTLIGVGLGVLIAAPAGYVLSRRAMAPINVAFERQRAFVADASHELRTPLTLIRANAEFAQLEPELPVADVAASLEQILREVDRTDRLVDDLLVLARLDAGQLPLERRPISATELVQEACNSMRPLFEARRITLETCVISDGDVLADRDWVQQALRVVLDNAAKYTEPGGTVVFETTREREHIAFAVRDTGQGIPPDQLPRVFERFYRVDSSRSREHGGAGLGLAIARGIIEMHGGSIVIESQLGVGTTVTIKLPAASGQRDSAGEAAPAPQDDPP